LFVTAEKSRAEGEIMEATLRSLAKAVRPFCEENDLYVNRKKLASRLPPARSQANNRKPRGEELLAEYPNTAPKPSFYSQAEENESSMLK
jgi:hypothetical protein